MLVGKGEGGGQGFFWNPRPRLQAFATLNAH